MSAPEKPECGYMESEEMPVCPEPGDPLCDRHSQPRFSVCVGCGGDANHLCRGEAPGDRAALCPECVHYHDDGTHGPFDAERAERAAEAAQSAAAPGEPQAQPRTPDALREDLSEALVLSLRRSRKGDLSDMAAARRAIDDLGTTLLMNTLTGLAGAREGGN